MFIFRFIGPLLLFILVYWWLQRLSKRHSLTTQQFKWLLGIATVLVGVVALVMLGRIPIQSIVAPVVLALTFALRNIHLLIRVFPMLQSLNKRVRGGAKGTNADVSTIRTAFLAMELQHSTGEMDGEVLQGQFTSNRLSKMSIDDLLILANECRRDSDSIQILESYLDRQCPDWREHADAKTTGKNAMSAPEESMTEALALEILGLESGATEEEITAAHRKLMQKMHPDRGGSDYLARKINAARDFLVP